MTTGTISDTRPTTSVKDGLSPDDLVAKAASLRELLREQAPEGDKGQCSESVVRALEDNSLLRLTIPKRYDGLEVSTHTLVDVLVELARGDGSAGWSAMLLNIGNWFASTWPVQAQDEIWGEDPHAKTAAIINPMTVAEPVEGGFKLSGKWPFASGSYIATHAILGFFAPQPDGSKRHVMGIVLPGEWSVDKSWAPMGLKGTGSDTIVVDDVFVPNHRVQDFGKMVEGRVLTEEQDQEAQSRAAFLPKGTIIFSAIQVGLAKAIADHAIDRIQNKGVTGTRYTEARNSPTHQLAAADGSTRIDLAELLIHRAADMIDDFALRNETMPELLRAQVRNDTGMIVTLAGEAIDMLMKSAGTSSYLQSNPMSRILADHLTGGSHAHATPQVGREVYGRLLVGADGGVTVDV